MSVERGDLTGRSRSRMDIPGKAAELEIEEEEYRSLLRLFLTNAATEVEQIEAAIRADDLMEVARLAHSLKGASATLGLTELLSIVESMDASARARTLSPTDARLSLLKQRIGQISESIVAGRG